ncbi:MAG: hypothetical protein A3G34_08440 [Candidatus Lindowbacteria bacterium RIFCSPLOWO2_12_FULL_62_27]|nr:MAG: hypothetical protein A3G34_08440 [Candidatus Lindowbacteria bacterium RIFCSPLOWO2_12_FULL_62_27]OGH62927.1 MAG: hypothetical protein A3I06_13685 [Candidatus Lindowbacteria bacterium RIFCSPLOWO2_02_FULL_62_12]
MDAGKRGWPITVSAAFCGCAGAIYVCAFQRTLALVFGEGVYTESVLWAAVLICFSVGGWIGGRAPQSAERILFISAILAGVLGLISNFILGFIAALYAPAYYAVKDHPSLVLLIAFFLGLLSMAGPLMATGAAIFAAGRASAENLESPSSAVGRILAVTLAGGAIGALLPAFLLIPNLGLGKTLVAAAALDFVCAGLLFLSERSRTMKSFTLLFAVFALAGGFLIYPGTRALSFGGWWLPAANLNIHSNEAAYAAARQKSTLIFEENDAAGPIQVYWIKPAENEPAIQRLIVGAKIRGDFLGPGQLIDESLSMLAVVLHPRARRCLVLGLGAGTALTSMRTLMAESDVDCVDDHPALAQVVEKLFYPRFGEIGKGRLIADDPGHFLRVTTDSYDVVLSRPLPPYRDASSAFLFTDDFYRLIGARLSEGGLFAQCVSFSELGGMQRAVVIKTFSRNFPYARIYEVGPGWTVFLGSLSHLARGGRQAIEDIEKAGNKSHAGMMNVLMDEFQIRQMGSHAAASAHTADRPVLEYMGAAGVPVR